MPTISQNLSLPGNVQTGGTVQASDVATLYSTLNAFNLPGTVGVFQQGFVDNNKYTSTAGSFTDWTFSASASKAVFFLIPFAWSGSSATATLNIRYNGTVVTTSTAFIAGSNSSGEGLIVGFVGPRSTDATRVGFAVEMDNTLGNALRQGAFTVSPSTSDLTSMGLGYSTAGAGGTLVQNGVRFWVEG